MLLLLHLLLFVLIQNFLGMQHYFQYLTRHMGYQLVVNISDILNCLLSQTCNLEKVICKQGKTYFYEARWIDSQFQGKRAEQNLEIWGKNLQIVIFIHVHLTRSDITLKLFGLQVYEFHSMCQQVLIEKLSSFNRPCDTSFKFRNIP